MFDQVWSLEMAARSSESYMVSRHSPVNAAILPANLPSDSTTSPSTLVTASGI